MGDWITSVRTAALTLLGGAVLFVINQWVQKFFFEPLQEQRKAIGEIDFVLTFWAWAYANAPLKKSEETSEAQDALRGCPSKVIASTNAVRAYQLARRFGAPAQSHVKKAARHLIGLSNSIHSGKGCTSREDAKTIRTLLNLSLDAKELPESEPAKPTNGEAS